MDTLVAAAARRDSKISVGSKGTSYENLKKIFWIDCSTNIDIDVDKNTLKLAPTTN